MSNGIYYILEGHEPKPVKDLFEWARWFGTVDRTVARTELSDGVLVSTVFSGIDRQYGEGPPLLFETMIFGGPLDQETDRYSTWDEAEKGHHEMLEKAKMAQIKVSP